MILWNVWVEITELFLMYRMELKGVYTQRSRKKLIGFLMYRMELKDFSGINLSLGNITVPNVPYGVERHPLPVRLPLSRGVPNVPYGVERSKQRFKKARLKF